MDLDIASISAGTAAQVQKLSGIDTTMYRRKERNPHVFVWKQCPMWAGEYIGHPISEVRAGATNCVCKVDTDCDEIYTGYFYIQAPAIKGIKSKNHQSFPTVKRSNLRRADRELAKRTARNTFDLGDEDDPDFVRDGVDAFLQKNYGGGGTREPLPCEGPATTVASATTRETRTPGQSKYYAYYISDWAKEAIPTYSIKLGGNVVDTIVNKYAHIALDLCYSEGHRMGLRELTGYASTREELIERSSMDMEGWYPMLLWHNRSVQKSLKMCYMDWAPVVYYVTTSPFERLIVRANKHTKVVKLDGQELLPTDLRVCIVLHEIVLDEETKAALRDKPKGFDILIKQHDCKVFTEGFNNCDIKVTHPVIAYWFCVHRAAAEQDNLPFHWWGAFDREPIKSVRVRFGNKDRQRRQPAILYRVIQPLEKHTSCPTPFNCYYTYGFAFNNESQVPEGSANAARFQKVILDVELQKGLENEDVTLYVFSENWMVLTHKDKTAYPLFI